MRFAAPFFFWLFLVVLPFSLFTSTLHLYIHEIAHGLTALAAGGRFIGIRMDEFNRKSPSLAYADVWTKEYDTLMRLAGIAVSVTIGILLLWQAHRRKTPMPRLLFLLAAASFLQDWGYAFEGALLWDTTEFDTAVAIRKADSLLVHGIAFVFLFAAYWGSTFLVSSSLFRSWENMLGPLTKWKAFWVALLLVVPGSFPTIGVEGAEWSVLVYFIVLNSNMLWLVRTRRKEVPPISPVKLTGWVLGIWAGASIAIVGILFLYRGIRLDS
jgi:hypothetical protein